MNNEKQDCLKKVSFRELFLFFIPLAIQAASQSLTYPLVGSVVSHGKYGAQEFAAYVPGQQIMFFIGSLGIGLITTCMVFGRSKSGLRNFLKLNYIITATVTILQILCCLPPFDKIIFSQYFGLEGDLATIAMKTTLYGIVMNIAFFFRNPYQATLIIEKKGGRASCGTFVRIGLTWTLAIIFTHIGLVGWKWGLALTTVCCWIEALICRYFAMPFMRQLPVEDKQETASVGKQFNFTMPLSLGGILLSGSVIFLSGFLAKTPDPTVARPIHYIVFGLINPIAAGALRMQAITIAYPPNEYGLRSTQVFAIMIGMCLGVLSLVAQIPSAATWYFCSIQNIPAENLRAAMLTMLVVAPVPLVQALRAHTEGMAAVFRKPKAVLCGNCAYVTVLIGACCIFLHYATDFMNSYCYLAGAIAVMCSQFTAFLVTRFTLIATNRRHSL